MTESKIKIKPPLSVLMAILPAESGLAGFTAAKDDGMQVKR